MYGGEAFTNWVGAVGSATHPNIAELENEFYAESLIEEVADSPWWSEREYSRWLPDRRQFSVSLAGNRIDFAPTEGDYAAAGIIFNDDRSGPGSLNPGQMLRFLCHHLDHPFFASEARLRTLIDPEIEPETQLFLQVAHWRHPVFLLNVNYPPDYEMWPEDVVRNIPCWQVLSRVIVSGDTTEWYAQDTTGFNTDWLSLERIRYENDGEGYDNTIYDS